MQHIIDFDGTATLYNQWIALQQATLYLAELNQSINWQEETIKLFGKSIKCPRLTAWYGDEGIQYSYSGVRHIAKSWVEPLYQLRQLLYAQFNLLFNSVLCNLYRDGRDHMGWHSDDEREIVPGSTIASISFGATRPFQFRHKISRTIVNTELSNGSLLLMGDDIQRCWQHRLPPKTKLEGLRVNLTFRVIQTG